MEVQFSSLHDYCARLDRIGQKRILYFLALLSRDYLMVYSLKLSYLGIYSQYIH